MKTVIDKNRAERHTIDRYKFKVFGMGGSDRHAESKVSVFAKTAETHDAHEPEPLYEEAVPEEPVQTGSRDDLIESLMKKADEMSSSVIKMQMKIEEMEAAHKAALEVEKAKSYQDGMEAGAAEAAKAAQTREQEALERFTNSVATLETRAEAFHKALEGIKADLLHAAIDIAKEVVSIEVGEHGSRIATKLAEQLIEDLQEASKITLRVNPADHKAVAAALASAERVDVVADSAINRGGVVAISDGGNIDAEVMKRFERIKSAALSG